MLLKIYSIVIVLLLCSLQSAVAFNPRISRNGFVATAGIAPQGKHIATGWSMGIPISGFSESGPVSLASGFWSKQYLASPPLAPNIISPRLVLSETTGQFDSIDFPLAISGEKPPNVTYIYHTLVIAYTNGAEFKGIIQSEKLKPWELSLELNEGDFIELVLFSSNMYGSSATPTVLEITQIPEPIFFMFILIIILFSIIFFRKHKYLICFSILLITLFNATEGHCVEFNYQGVIELEGGAYSGDGYFKFTIGNATQTTNYWANDGTIDGEPTASVLLNVSNGFFHTALGNSEMLPIPRSLFTGSTELFLTVWFHHLPIDGFYKLGSPQEILPVPTAINSDLLDGHDYEDIINTVFTNYTDQFLLRTGDICSGQLQASNLVTDTNVELPDDGRVYLNSSKDAYISAGNSGNITIFKNNLPVFEIE